MPLKSTIQLDLDVDPEQAHVFVLYHLKLASCYFEAADENELLAAIEDMDPIEMQAKPNMLWAKALFKEYADLEKEKPS